MNLLDEIIGFFNPKEGIRRAQARIALDQVRKFDGAAKGRRTSGWGESKTSANAEIKMAIGTLRDRARELVRNNSYAFNAIEGIVINTIGTGILLSPKSKNKAVRDRVRAEWLAWAESTACDFDGQMNFYGLQELVMRAVAESGEALIVRRFGKDDSGKRVLQLQVLEGDYIDHGKDVERTEGGGKIVAGVEFNKIGKRIGYWLFNGHPGEASNNATSEFVKADNVLHVYRKLRPGQARGIPFGVAAMLRLHDLRDYQDAQLLRQKLAACYVAFVQDSDADAITTSSSDVDLPQKLEPGTIEMLPTGKTVTFASPPGTEGYGDYTKKVLQEVAVGYGVTYEVITGDLSNVNFSSGRMGWIEFHRRITSWQWNMFIPMFLEGVWRWYSAVNEVGDVTAGWTVPRREMIDPDKENKGIALALVNRLTSWSEAVRERGYEPEELAAEIAADMALFDSLGIVMPTDPPPPTPGGDVSTTGDQASA